jgi:hypothetical protein
VFFVFVWAKQIGRDLPGSSANWDIIIFAIVCSHFNYQAHALNKPNLFTFSLYTLAFKHQTKNQKNAQARLKISQSCYYL